MKINLFFKDSTLYLLALVMLTFSCTGPPIAESVSLVPNPNPQAPLAGILTFTSDRPVVASLFISDGENQQTVIPDSDFKSTHDITVLGLRPDRNHQVIVTITDEDGKASTLDTLEVQMAPLPADFPKMEITQAATQKVEPGVTMINLFRWTDVFKDDKEWGMAAIVDENGEVVWYYQSNYGLEEFRRMYNGNLITGGNKDGRLFEIDMRGNIVNEWHTSGVVLGNLKEGSIPVATDAFHHDVIELKNGNFIGLGLEVRAMENFPLAYPPEEKYGNANLATDILIEFGKDGSTKRKWAVADILDPKRIGEGSLRNDFYKTLYEGKYDSLELPYDISHCNAIYYIEEEDALLVSSYLQCIIYKIDMKSGELLWMLGDPTAWKEPWTAKLLKPKGDFIYPYHQHGIEMTPEGNLLVYDNGGSRYIPPNKPMPVEEQFTRAVEFKIDEAAGTVEEVWSYGPKQESFVAPFIGDADYLPETGNILVCDGGRFKGPDGEPMNTFGGHQWGRIFETTHDENPVKIWELTIYDPEVRYSAYRAQRFLSLYPKLDKPTG